MKKQIELDIINYKASMGKSFGGAGIKAHPKTKRPFSRKHLIHIVLKSSKANGSRSFLHSKNRKMIDKLVRATAFGCDVNLRDFVNVGNHIHILLKARHRNSMIKFLRVISGVIPRKILNCEKGSPLKERFWDGRPFSKILASGAWPFKTIKKYFDKNRRQAKERAMGLDMFFAMNSS